ncbi:MAG: metal ABC transporter permease [Planctomycetota bacterium]
MLAAYFADTNSAWPTWLAALATAGGCAALSPIIVAKRWAFVSEGIGHSAYGGAGVVWLLAVLLPAADVLRGYGAVIVAAGLAAMVTALLIGYLQRRAGHTGLGFDTATGVVLTASLAMGFFAQSIFAGKYGGTPMAATSLLFGSSVRVTTEAGLAALGVTSAVIAGLLLFRREVLSWTLDADGATLQGVPGAAVQYGLLVALAATVALGAQLVGAVLVTALLVVPGAAATLVGRQMQHVWLLSTAAALVAMLGGLGMQTISPAVPLGPAVVGMLVLEFVVALTAQRLLISEAA